MSPLITISVLLSLALLIYNYILHPLFISPLSKIPAVHPTSRFSYYWVNKKEKSHQTGVKDLLQAHKKHGPVILVSPGEVSICSLNGLRQVYNSGAWEKTPWYEEEFKNYGVPNLVSTVANRAHSFQKRMISNVYSKSFIQSSKDLDVLSRKLIFERLFPVLEDASKGYGGQIDAYGLSIGLGADSMNAYLFGTANGTDFIRDARARNALMKDFRVKFMRLPGGEAAGKVVEDFILRMCESAERQPFSFEDVGSLLPHTNAVVYPQLLSRLEKEGVSPASPRVVAASEMMDQIVAAIETTRVAMTYLQWELSQRPELMRALRAEFLSLDPPLNIPVSESNVLPELPDPKAIDALPLLSAVLKETLRVYTPSPAPFPRMSPPSGAVIDGYFIPGGISAATNAYCLHRMESVYANAEAWKPERWLGLSEDGKGVGVDGGKGGRTEMERWFWAFGSGGRMCIGSHFAVQMLKLSIAAIYTNYSTMIVDDEGIEPCEGYIAGPKGEKLVLRLIPVKG